MFQFPGFPPHALCIYAWVTGLQPAGFPHSDIKGSMPACGSPLLFAACHVLLRRLVPWHPPRYIYFRLLSNLFLCNWSFKTFSRLSSLCSCQGAWVISHPPLPILSFGLGLSLPFGILKTIQMIEQQLFLTSRFRAFLCPVCTGLSLLRFSLSAYFAIDLGLKVPLSLRLTP